MPRPAKTDLNKKVKFQASEDQNHNIWTTGVPKNLKLKSSPVIFLEIKFFNPFWGSGWDLNLGTSDYGQRLYQ